MSKSQTHPSYNKDVGTATGQELYLLHIQCSPYPRGLTAYMEWGKKRMGWAPFDCTTKWSVYITQETGFDFRPLSPPLLLWAFPREITSSEAQIRSVAKVGFKPRFYPHVGLPLFLLFGLMGVNKTIPVLKAKQVSKLTGPRSDFLLWGKK